MNIHTNEVVRTSTEAKHVESVRMDRILSEAITTAAMKAGANRSKFIRQVLHVHLNQQKP